MSSFAQTSDARRNPLTVVGGVLAVIVAASAVNAVVAVIARAVADKPDDFGPLDPGSYIFLTAVGVILGAVGWAVVRRASKRPAELLHKLVPAVIVVSFVPDFFLFGDGGAAGVIALLVMHVAVATIAVPVFRRVMPLTTR
ncbi:DUF6069 family protein [Streptomyces sp. NPDC096311]|uniref:DUF6069 family protein n=1 Tax=Streptomyces sp. NPDC096311 TaxID=3366083 RepID=UPI0037FE4C37